MNTKQPTPDFSLPVVSKEHREALEAVSSAVLALDLAFERLPDAAFEVLPEPYKELADAVLRCYWGDVEPDDKVYSLEGPFGGH